jgi:hypothetical protein
LGDEGNLEEGRAAKKMSRTLGREAVGCIME